MPLADRDQTRVGVVGALGEAAPLGLAVAATLTAAGVAYLLQAPAPFETDLTRPADWLRGGIATLASCLGALAVLAVFPEIADFLCEPLVPWRIAIALFGAFAMSWLATGVALRSPSKLAGLMIYLAFFWIAPFYGFFHAPWFLAQTIVVPCAERPFAQAVIAAAGMALAAHAGHRTGDRMSGKAASAERRVDLTANDTMNNSRAAELLEPRPGGW